MNIYTTCSHHSNSGFIAFMDNTFHFKHELTIHFYSKIGQPLFSKTFKGASLFGFSSKGNKFAVGTGKHLYVISIPEFQIETCEPGDQFNISENEKFVAIAKGGKVRVYSEDKMQSEFKTGFVYPRKIQISEAWQQPVNVIRLWLLFI